MTATEPAQYSSYTPHEIVKRLQATYPDIPSFTYTSGATTWLVFCGPLTTTNPSHTPGSNPRVLIELTTSCKRYCLEVHFQRLQSFNFDENEDQLSTLLSSLRENSGYVLCPGLPVSCSVTFESKNLRQWGPMFQRSDHRECYMWHLPTQGATSTCPKCSRLSYHLQDMVRRKKSLSPRTKKKRTNASSKYPKRYLTPTSRAERERNEKKQALANKKAAKKLRKLDVDVNNITNDELIAIVAELERTSKDVL